MDSSKPIKRGAAAPKRNTDRRGGVKSCLRALDVIEFFTTFSAPARTVQVSEALEIPNSSADELLRTLAASGYLNYNADTKYYSPSYKLVAKSRAIEQSFFGGGIITNIMRDIQAEVGGSVYLTQQNGCWVDSVAEVPGSWVEDAQPRYPLEMVCYVRNSWLPSTNFSSVMLTRHTNAQLANLTAKTQEIGVGPEGPSPFMSLVSQVAKTRARGYSVYRKNGDILVDSIAVPLFMKHSVTAYAIGIVGQSLFASKGDEKQMARAMQSVIGQHLDRLDHPRSPIHTH